MDKPPGRACERAGVVGWGGEVDAHYPEATAGKRMVAIIELLCAPHKNAGALRTTMDTVFLVALGA